MLSLFPMTIVIVKTWFNIFAFSRTLIIFCFTVEKENKTSSCTSDGCAHWMDTSSQISQKNNDVSDINLILECKSALLNNTKITDDGKDLWCSLESLPGLYAVCHETLVLFANRYHDWEEKNEVSDYNKLHGLNDGLKTLKELRRIVLDFGLGDSKSLLKEVSKLLNDESLINVRPGYSPNRYVSSAVKVWDPLVTEKMLKDKLLNEALIKKYFELILPDIVINGTILSDTLLRQKPRPYTSVRLPLLNDRMNIFWKQSTDQSLVLPPINLSKNHCPKTDSFKEEIAELGTFTKELPQETGTSKSVQLNLLEGDTMNILCKQSAKQSLVLPPIDLSKNQYPKTDGFKEEIAELGTFKKELPQETLQSFQTSDTAEILEHNINKEVFNIETDSQISSYTFLNLRQKIDILLTEVIDQLKLGIDVIMEKKDPSSTKNFSKYNRLSKSISKPERLGFNKHFFNQKNYTKRNLSSKILKDFPKTEIKNVALPASRHPAPKFVYQPKRLVSYASLSNNGLSVHKTKDKYISRERNIQIEGHTVSSKTSGELFSQNTNILDVSAGVSRVLAPERYQNKHSVYYDHKVEDPILDSAKSSATDLDVMYVNPELYKIYDNCNGFNTKVSSTHTIELHDTYNDQDDMVHAPQQPSHNPGNVVMDDDYISMQDKDDAHQQIYPPHLDEIYNRMLFNTTLSRDLLSLVVSDVLSRHDSGKCFQQDLNNVITELKFILNGFSEVKSYDPEQKKSNQNEDEAAKCKSTIDEGLFHIEENSPVQYNNVGEEQNTSKRSLPPEKPFKTLKNEQDTHIHEKDPVDKVERSAFSKTSCNVSSNQNDAAKVSRTESGSGTPFIDTDQPLTQKPFDQEANLAAKLSNFQESDMHDMREAIPSDTLFQNVKHMEVKAKKTREDDTTSFQHNTQHDFEESGESDKKVYARDTTSKLPYEKHHSQLLHTFDKRETEAHVREIVSRNKKVVSIGSKAVFENGKQKAMTRRVAAKLVTSKSKKSPPFHAGIVKEEKPLVLQQNVVKRHQQKQNVSSNKIRNAKGKPVKITATRSVNLKSKRTSKVTSNDASSIHSPVHEHEESMFTIAPSSPGRVSIDSHVVQRSPEIFVEEDITEFVPKQTKFFKTYTTEICVVKETISKYPTSNKAEQRRRKAEARRAEVERKRKEKELQRLQAIEEQKRQEKLQREFEEEEKRKREERLAEMLLKEEKRKAEELRKLQAEKEAEKQRHKRLAEEEAARQKIEKLIAQKQAEVEFKREQERLAAEIEADLLRKEQEFLEGLDEESRAFYEREKARDEEEKRIQEEKRGREMSLKRKEEEEKRQREMEELELLHLKMLRKRFFAGGVRRTDDVLIFNQKVNRSFTYSYNELLPIILHTSVMPVTSSNKMLPSLSDLLTSLENEEQ
ncbi:reticulocyte-binding protein homolog 2a-like [Hydractinia symbiolongicarpus]|uniref:reticulocyte-binding protein homolog 2a-like n=1 Tax=Hydractinia symbiolongicarpus TaxID=13093 RepID=UPI00254E4BB4|nr:reticulocyte-binding protein homolog 2a-like [Hydractinia symbiolongicarpus]